MPPIEPQTDGGLAPPWQDVANGNFRDETKRIMVFAIGNNPDDAIKAFCAASLWECSNLEPLPLGRDPMLQWGRRFTANGTSMKAAGCYVPGGAVMTWWK